MTAHGSNENLVRLTEDYLAGVIAHHTKLTSSDLAPTTPLDRLGVQSIMMLKITHDLEQDLGQLSKTLFFEHSTIRELSAHLIEIKPAELSEHFGQSVETEPEAPTPNLDPGPSEDAQLLSQSPKTMGGKLELVRARARQRESMSGSQTKGRRSVDTGPIVSDCKDRAATPNEVAIIGMAGRFPGAANLDEYWNNLLNGRDCVSEVPRRRWNHGLFYQAGPPTAGRSYCRTGGFIDEIEYFDPLFFRISPAEATVMDPQERLFLQTAWQVVEDAGYSHNELAGERVGVYAGLMTSQYQLLNTQRFGGWMNGGGIYASIANRVSHFFDFCGPSLTLDTMCSSSLTTLHLACRALLDGEAELAIAGGVNLMVHPAKYLTWAQYRFLSPSGRCHAFGESADGYVPGEGVGALLLKPLQRAIDDGDNIRAVISGSAINQTGRTSAFYVPSPDSQADVMHRALAAAQVSPSDISYIEAHGTGTELGDPIEISGLQKAYGDSRSRPTITLGSVKSSIGHLESAAGVASLIKVVLQLEHETLVPSLHADPPSPHIDFAEAALTVPHAAAPWTQPTTGLRRAAVSAFGAGGSNAHVILRQAPERADKPGAPVVPLVLLSAQGQEQLQQLVSNWLGWLNAAEGSSLQSNQARSALAAILGVDQNQISPDLTPVELGLDQFQIASYHRLLSEQFAGLADDPQRVLNLTLAEVAQADSTAAPDDIRLPSLNDVAYTSQVGRTAMTSRLALVCDSLDQLRQQLTQFAAGTRVTGVQAGDAPPSQDTIVAAMPEDLRNSWLNGLVAEAQWNEIARLWVSGFDIDWRKLWSGSEHGSRRTRIPTYPFRKDLCWITPVQPGESLVPDAVAEEISGRARTSGAKPQEPSTPVDVQSSTVVSDRPTSKDVWETLTACIDQVLGIAPDRLHRSTRLEDLGLDSVRITHLTEALAQHFGDLPTTLLFSYSDLGTLEQHLRQRSLTNSASPWSRNGGESGDDASEPAPGSAQVPSPAPAPDPESGPKPKPVPEPSETRELVSSPTQDMGGFAVIGLSGRYPGADDVTGYADLLAAGENCVTEVPAERWDWRDYPEVSCRWGGFISGATEFDPTFFGVSPKLAEYMDPQERLFIQTAWHCLEDSGYRPDALARDGRASVGVFVGASYNEYPLYGAASLREGKQVILDSQMYSIANRVSYLFDLAGPSLVIDTACASSLHAIHLAAQSLSAGECELAIAGGVNLSLHPSKYLNLATLGFLAPDGQCRSFGQGGAGYVPAEGVGAVLLKPLDRAIADGDRIYAVVKGSAVAHGGRTQGYTVPNPSAQAEVISRALSAADVETTEIGLIEAHGTGTELGDPIEIDGLSQVFAASATPDHRIPVASVKSSIGHAEAAAGIAQLTKVIAQISRKQIFPHRTNSEQPNPGIDWESVPFRIPRQLEPWSRLSDPEGEPLPRRAGISSFGVGGVSVHLVLEEPPQPHDRAEVPRLPEIVVLSAETPEQLDQQMVELRTFLSVDEQRDVALADVALTLRTGRKQLPYRAACVASDISDLLNQLDLLIAGSDGERAFRGQADSNDAETVDQPAQVPELTALARRWVVGEVQLGHSRQAARARRVGLPRYPYSRRRYWFYDSQVRPGVREESTPIDPDDSVETNRSTPMADQSSDSQSNPGADSAIASLLMALDEAPTSEHQSLMSEHVLKHLSEAMGFDAGHRIDLSRGLFDLGLDSLVAANLYSTFESQFGSGLDDQLFFNYPSVNKVAAYLLEFADEHELSAPVIRTEAPVENRASDIDAADPSVASDLALLEDLSETESDDGLDALSESELAELLETELRSLSDLEK